MFAKPQDDEQSDITFRRDKRRLGLIYGLLGGLTFALATWGSDAWQLYQAHAADPWLKLILGGVVSLLLFGLAGWVTGWLDKVLVGVAAWVLAGVGVVMFASRVPFEVSTLLSVWRDPRLAGLALYPYAENISARLVIIFIVMLLALVLAGGLQTFLVEAARSARVGLRWLMLGVSIPLLAMGASASQDLNEPLRQPLVNLNRLLSYAVEHRGQTLTPQEIRDMHLRAFEDLQDYFGQPYRLVLGTYSSEYLDNVSIYVDFGGVWGTCQTTVNLVANCELSTERYAKRLACLLNEGSACGLRLTDAGRAWVETWTSQGRPEPQISVATQRGLATVLTLSEANGTTYTCRLVEGQAIWLEGCTPEPAGQPAPSPTAPVSVDASGLADQRAALLPEAQGDLARLSNTPHYRLQFTLDPAAHAYQGQATVVYTNTEDVAIEQLYFRLIPNGGGSYGRGALNVTETRLDGQAVTPRLSLSNSILEIPLPTALPPGGRVEAAFTFNGATPLDFDGGYGIYNSTAGVLALANAYPILAVYDADGWNLDPVSNIGDSVYSDMARYTVTITAPKDLVLAATGVSYARQEAGDLATQEIISGPARDFFIIGSADFQVATQTVNGTRLNSYYLPGHQAKGEMALSITADALTVYNRKFGVYPLTELDVVGAPLESAGGVEFPGIVLIADSYYAETADDHYLVTVVAHEVAHQWWYNMVGSDVFDEPWVDEALTTYTSIYYTQAVFGADYYSGMLDYYRERYDSVNGTEMDDLITETLAHYEKLASANSYGAVVYAKGALFFDALRTEIGDKAFFAALQAYYAEHQYGIARGADLLAAFETAAGRELDEVYQKWLYER